MKRYKIIAAMNNLRGIGLNGSIPWKPDYFFLKKTLGRKLLVGKNTKLPHLPHREIVVANHLNSDMDVDYVIGGEKLYRSYISGAKKIYLTLINNNIQCDTWFPEIPKHFYLLKRKKMGDFYVESYINMQIDFQYFKLVKNILGDNTMRGIPWQFNCKIQDGMIPIISSKKVFIRGVIEELLFFLRGETNTKILEERGINIWKANTSREYLDKRKLYHLEEGMAGPVYGAQWVKQIPEVIDELVNNPSSRRCLFTAWIPTEIEKMCLPPCHVIYQFYLHDNILNLHMFQRSCDVFLGLPFNLTSCCFMIIIFAYYLSNRMAKKIFPGSVYVSISHAHIYSDHVDAISKQLNNNVHEPAKYTFNTDYKDDILEYFKSIKYENFKIDYKSEDKINAKIII